MLAISCQEEDTSSQSGTTQERMGWQELSLESRPFQDNQVQGSLQLAVAKAISPLQEQRLAVSRQLGKEDTRPAGFSPHYAPLMDRVAIFGPSDAAGQRITVFLVPVEERGVAHAHQQNLLFVAISAGEKTVPVATLVGIDSALVPEGLALWRSDADEKIRLFVVSAGPTFQGSASMCLNAWVIKPSNATVARLLTISGPETILGDHSLKLDVTAGKMMTVDVRLGRDADMREEPERRSLLEVEHADKSVNVSMIGTHAARIHIR